MLITLILILLLFGFALLSMAMHRHYSQVIGLSMHPARQQLWLLRIGGTGLNLIALFVCVFSWGVSRGLVYWFGSATMVVFIVIGVLTYRPRWLRWICRPVAYKL
ncbi:MULTISPECIES: DUF3325 domain-containing protein [unclassified Pseudoalteromonas]|uniref:DUF3325 domain-containing protein n=1 Tax=unclassified Pseudoalteromonas TaxID=194690 RepID=UPI0020970FF2|nr:DUF3325 domain-containing protein [Pseudoalteromonas sp. XMcav2-N]MCO7189566.1 DUF3325 domain-containing protein [Pseudoalteromonas sp. XMcav2-N]